MTAVSTVRAQVWLGARNFALREFVMPEPAPGEAVAEVDLATICGSDVHTVNGRRSGPNPAILGHEAVGRIVALGSGGVVDQAGTALTVGDRVVWSVTATCGECDRCRAGRSAKCRQLLKTGHEPLSGRWGLSGGYATHILLHRGLTLVRVPDAVPDPSAAMAACALATVMACMEAAGDLTGQRVLVSGVGMLGLCATAVAAERGAAEVQARDPDPRRRDLAARFGADQAVDPAHAGAGVVTDVLIELSGSPVAVEAAPDTVDIGGRVVLAGSVAPRGMVRVDPEHLVRSLISIVGVHNYEPRHLVEAIDFLASTTYDFMSVIAEPAALTDLPGELVADGGALLRRAVAPGY